MERRYEMYQGKYYVFVCCGAGKLTSFMAKEGIKKGLKTAGLLDGVTVEHGKMGDIVRKKDYIDILVTSSNYKGEFDFPVLNGSPFVTYDAAGQKVVIEEICNLIKELKEKE